MNHSRAPKTVPVLTKHPPSLLWGDGWCLLIGWSLTRREKVVISLFIGIDISNHAKLVYTWRLLIYKINMVFYCWHSRFYYYLQDSKLRSNENATVDVCSFFTASIMWYFEGEGKGDESCYQKRPEALEI